MSFDITAVINGHREGLLATSSLRSFKRAVGYARSKGLTVEMIAVLDKADTLTTEIFEDFQSQNPDFRIINVSHGDSGFSRNTAGLEASGEWIGFLDADDFWGENWLAAAHDAGVADPRQIAWHPEVNVYFGVTPHLFIHVDMEDPRYTVAGLVHGNYWTSLCFTRTNFFRSVPNTGTELDRNIGYEDWSWNIDVIKNGGLHKIVPGTSHAIRTKSVSVVKRTTAANCIPRPTDFFRRIIGARKIEA